MAVNSIDLAVVGEEVTATHLPETALEVDIALRPVVADSEDGIEIWIHTGRARIQDRYHHAGRLVHLHIRHGRDLRRLDVVEVVEGEEEVISAEDEAQVEAVTAATVVAVAGAIVAVVIVVEAGGSEEKETKRYRLACSMPEACGVIRIKILG